MDSKYQEKINELVMYFKSGEKEINDFKIGMELEHFILEKDTLKAIPYYGENGIKGILLDLINTGWKPVYEGEYIFDLKGDYANISLEPGGQMEFSLVPVKNINEIKTIYLKILDELYPLLKKGIT